MLRPAEFLVRTAAIFDVAVPAESVAQVRTFDSIQAAGASQGFAYERAAIDAINRIAGDGLEVAKSADASWSDIDLELHDAGHRIAVVVNFSIRAPMRSDRLRSRVNEAIVGHYDKLLVVSNVDIRDGDRQRLLGVSIVTRFTTWRSPEDDEVLGGVIQELRAVKTEEDR
jgi:hypothetical protein